MVGSDGILMFHVSKIETWKENRKTTEFLKDDNFKENFKIKAI